MDKPARVLIVEDEPKLAALLADYLRLEGIESEWIADGRAVAPALATRPPDLVLLDLMLPGRDGIEVCRDIRRTSDVPIIMVTARVEEVDRLLGLELGADDYICKPFSPREVVARVKANLRRVRRLPMSGATSGFLIDEDHHRVTYEGRVLDLTPVEFRLLRTLATAPGRVFSREQLMDKLYDDHRVVTDRTIDSHVKNLRRKLSEVVPDAEPIRSIYGVGYKLESG